MTLSKNFGPVLLTGLLTPACALWGVEPDEIDVALEETESGFSTGATNGGDGDGDAGSDTEGDPGDGDPGDGDGDGDPTGTGDGDGDDAGDGDGDGDNGDGDGDGDGDTGDGDPGDGDGDTGDGDGDGDPGVPCESLDPIPLEEADNQIMIPDVMSSFEGSCGGTGPEAVFSFTATIDASYDFSIWGDGFQGIIYLVDESCVPLDEIECSVEPQSIVYPMLVGQVVYVIADTNNGPGAAQLTVAPI